MAFKLGSKVANLENLSEDGTLGATEDALDAAETAVDVADGNTEQVIEADEVDQLDLGVEDAMKAVDKVEELKEIAEDTMKDGGMDEATAKVVEVAHESLTAFLDMGHRAGGEHAASNPVMNFESYASATSRRAATLLTIEKLGETASKIFENIKKALAHAWTVVQNFFAGLLRNRALMEKHLKALSAKVKAIPNDAKMKKESFSSAAGAITANGKADASSAEDLLNSAEALLHGARRVASVIGNPTDGDAWQKTFQNALKEMVTKLPSNGKAHGHFTGGRGLVAGAEGTEGVIKVSFEEVSKKAESAKAPSKSDMDKLVGRAQVVLTTLREYEKAIADLKKGQGVMDRLLDKAKGMVASARGEDDEKKAERKGNEEVKKNARSMISAMNKLGAPVPQASFAAVKAVADYVTAGIGNYGAADKAPEAKKD